MKERKKRFYESDRYFDLSDATSDFRYSCGTKDVVSTLAKLAGKSAFNSRASGGKNWLIHWQGNY